MVLKSNIAHDIENIAHDVEKYIAEEYKYLGVHMDDKIDWTKNTEALYKKGQSRLIFQRLQNQTLKVLHHFSALQYLIYIYIIYTLHIYIYCIYIYIYIVASTTEGVNGNTTTRTRGVFVCCPVPHTPHNPRYND